LETLGDRFIVANSDGARLLCAFIREPDLTKHWLQAAELPALSTLRAGETAVLAFLCDVDNELLVVRRRVMMQHD
jgi:hypothetical protein